MKVGIIGAGTMGAGIAQAFAMTEGYEVCLCDIKMEFEVERMEPLFDSQAAYEVFKERHSRNHVKTAELSSYQGNVFLGIDAGSTTTKIALVGEDGSLLYSR